MAAGEEARYHVAEAFIPATILYRRACAQADQAAHRAAEFAKSGSVERRLREMDATISTIVLTQAAAEAWIHTAYRRSGTQPNPRTSWVQRWLDAPAIICPAPTRSLERSTERTLRELSTWDNYLVHGGDTARQRLHKHVPESDVPTTSPATSHSRSSRTWTPPSPTPAPCSAYTKPLACTRHCYGSRPARADIQ